jgi:pyrimidine-specific ribonucleoside hydrolase
MIVSMSALPVVLDVDTGVDDACALLLAGLSAGLDLRAVTCVAGNAPLGHVVRNTLTVLEVIGRDDVPVGVGAARPLLEEPLDARHVHGADGMADLGLPAPALTPDRRSALDLLRDTIDDSATSGRPVTVLPLAPMTNLALLARVHPQAFARIGRVVFMGGGAHVSNATAAAEFNVFHDPEAAAIVLDACSVSGVPVTMYGLDVFYEPMVSDSQVASLRAAGSSAARLAADLVSFHHRRFANAGATVGDAGAVAMLLEPDAVRTHRLPVRIELTGTWTRGRTVVDRRDWTGGLAHDPHGLAPAMVDVALEADGPRIVDLWLRTMHGAAAAGRSS